MIDRNTSITRDPSGTVRQKPKLDKIRLKSLGYDVIEGNSRFDVTDNSFLCDAGGTSDGRI